MQDKQLFQIGTTSFILPDNIVPNARFLADKVEDIQLLLFEAKDPSTLPTAKDIRDLLAIAGNNNITFSVHCPLDTSMGGEESVRQESVQRTIRAINITLPLSPPLFVLHLECDGTSADPGIPSLDMNRWLDQNRRSVEDILAAGTPPGKLCIETLSYPIALVEDIINDYHLSVCLDIGHLLIHGYSVENHIDRYLNRTKSMHLHGVVNGKDHKSISHLEPSLLDLVLSNIMKKDDLILTIEVFNEHDFLESIGIMKKLL